MSLITATWQREWALAWRNLSDALNPLVFFLMVVALVPLGTTANKQELAQIAPGIIWIAALLASLLSVDHLFRRDYEDGTLEQYALQGPFLYALVVIKGITHWLFAGLPLVVLSPVIGVMMGLPSAGYLTMMAALSLGSLALFFIGAMGAALTVSLRRGGLLTAVIVLPLYIPVLIFGASATVQAHAGSFPAGQLALLAAMALAALVLSPLLCASALRLAVDD